MSYLVGVVGLLGLAGLYVGLGLADRGRKGCGGCALRDDLEDVCGGSCPADATDDGTRKRPVP